MRISVALTALLAVIPALVLADTITVRMRPGYPVPNLGYSAFELKLVRPVIEKTAPADAIESVFREVEAAVQEAGIDTEWALLVPDAKSLEIRAEIGGRKIVLSSCHPFFESDARLVVTARGVESLGERSRSEVMASQPRSFQRGRKAFDRSLVAIMSYLRTKGEVFP